MPFGTGALSDPQKVQGGETFGNADGVISFTAFENNLVVGRFAKFDNSQIENLDASLTPTIAGIVRRNPANPIEDAATVDNTLWEKVDVIHSGYASVDVKSGETPAPFGAVTAHNVADADAGKALASGGVATNAIFIEEITTDVWLVALGTS